MISAWSTYDAKNEFTLKANSAKYVDTLNYLKTSIGGLITGYELSMNDTKLCRKRNNEKHAQYCSEALDSYFQPPIITVCRFCQGGAEQVH